MLSWPRRIVIARHGESEGNAKGLGDNSFRDHPNHLFSLTEKGRAQAFKAGERLRIMYGRFAVHRASTYVRTQQSQESMFPGVPYEVDSRLNELWRGIHHTMIREDVVMRYPAEAHIRQREGWYHYRPPGGQNGQDVELQIHSLLLDLRLNYAGEDVFLSAHGNWMILFNRLVMRKTPEEAEAWYREKHYPNCAIVEYAFESGVPQYVEWLNDSHPSFLMGGII